MSDEKPRCKTCKYFEPPLDILPDAGHCLSPNFNIWVEQGHDAGPFEDFGCIHHEAKET